jgi:hypothetical protein
MITSGLYMEWGNEASLDENSDISTAHRWKGQISEFASASSQARHEGRRFTRFPHMRSLCPQSCTICRLRIKKFKLNTDMRKRGARLGIPGLSGVAGLALVTLTVVNVVATSALGSRKLQQCPACSPSAAVTCAGMSSIERDSALGMLENACGSYVPSSCCTLRHSPGWETASACVCSGDEVSSVSMATVANICGCSASSGSRLAPLPDGLQFTG